jgi:hypothetical protein
MKIGFHVQYALQKNSSRSSPTTVKRKNEKKNKRGKTIPLEVILAMSYRAPNMSRKTAGYLLYPFPSFDRCDSLLFFPSSFSACINSGDVKGLSTLIKSRINPQCDISGCGRELNVEQLVTIFEVMNELHPDCVICVHSTKVVGNQIRATLYFKCTENRLIRASVKRNMADPSMLDMAPAPYENAPRSRRVLELLPEGERLEMAESVHVAENILIYGESLMVLTFDDNSKKITHFESDCWYTSFVPL